MAPIPTPTPSPVTSSAVRALGYDPRPQVLEVVFMSGRVYRYFHVPPERYHALRNAPSVGAYLNREIKGRYAYEELDVGPFSPGEF